MLFDPPPPFLAIYMSINLARFASFDKVINSTNNYSTCIHKAFNFVKIAKGYM